jgi:hypothetical protein
LDSKVAKMFHKNHQCLFKFIKGVNLRPGTRNKEVYLHVRYENCIFAIFKPREDVSEFDIRGLRVFRYQCNLLESVEIPF